MLFRTEDEEDQPTQQARPKSSRHRKKVISLSILTGGAEDEEEEEEEGDTPSLFKRVIIRVAKAGVRPRWDSCPFCRANKHLVLLLSNPRSKSLQF